MTRRGSEDDEARRALGYVEGSKGWRPRRWLSRVLHRMWRRVRGWLP